MDDVIRIKKLLKNGDILIDGVSETEKHEIKKQEDGLLETLGASMLGNMLTGKSVVRAGKGVVRTGIEFNNMDRMDKSFISAPFFNQYQDYCVLGLMVFIQKITYLGQKLEHIIKSHWQENKRTVAHSSVQ